MSFASVRCVLAEANCVSLPLSMHHLKRNYASALSRIDETCWICKFRRWHSQNLQQMQVLTIVSITQGIDWEVGRMIVRQNTWTSLSRSKTPTW